MNEALLAVVLGVVEGVTEFLPISSTAHLRIAQAALGLSLEDEFWKLFAVFIQAGAILSVVVYYRVRLLAFSREALALLPKPRILAYHPASLIAIAFFFTAIPAFLLSKVIGKNLESMKVIASAMIVGGIVMIAVDKFLSRGKTLRVEEMRPWQAAVVGLIQVLSAVFPGTSRSMSTIAGGQIVGLSREAALEFSFLVSVPVMAAATLYDLLKYIKDPARAALTGGQISTLAIGFAVSFVVAYFVIAWFLGFVRRHGFLSFGLYRILLGAYILLF